MENTIENTGNNLEQAQSIATEIKSDFVDLFAKAKETLETNPLLKDAVSKYGGLSMMLNEGFSFNAFREGAVNSKESIMAYDTFPLEGYLKANSNRINIENLEDLKDKFRERKMEVISSLSKAVTSEQEASELVDDIHTRLVLKVIETEPIFN